MHLKLAYVILFLFLPLSGHSNQSCHSILNSSIDENYSEPTWRVKIAEVRGNTELKKLSLTDPEQPTLETVAQSYFNGEYLGLTLDDLVSFDAKSLRSVFSKQSSLEGDMNRGVYSLDYKGKKYFLKMFTKKFWRMYKDAPNYRVEEDFMSEVQYLKLLSDLGWGAKFYGVAVHRGHLMGVITEQVSGELVREQKMLNAVQDLNDLKLIDSRRSIIQSLGIQTADFQFMYDKDAQKFWIIDATWAQRRDGIFPESVEETVKLIKEETSEPSGTR